jgi:hypothetical protein
MDESSLSSITDNSILSKETEFNSSYESNSSKEVDLKNQIINSISLSLNELIKRNQSQKIKQDIFYLGFIPPITLRNYINHLMQQTNMEISTLIISIIYIDRFCSKNNYYLNKNNIYRILLSSCLLGLKFNEDKIIKFKDYSEIAAVSVEDLKNLEFSMYLKLHFSLTVNCELYKSYYNYFSSYSIPKNEKKEDI